MKPTKGDICRFSMLYVEGEPSTRELIGGLLKISYPNIDVIFAENCIDALKIYQEETLDMFVIDLALSELHGLLLCQMVLSQRTESPIIVLTGICDEHLLEKSAKMGIQEYLVKPISVDFLMAKIHKISETIFWERINNNMSSKHAA
jgi:response regulator RpfG family c-di-GMP phosphodiesterase